MTPMKPQPTCHAGIDVSKSKLDLFLPSGGKAASFPNTAKGLARLLASLPRGCHAVCEATGGYERPLVSACLGAGVPVSVVCPSRVRHHALASGQLAKTDSIDAEVIASFADACRSLKGSVPL